MTLIKSQTDGDLHLDGHLHFEFNKDDFVPYETINVSHILQKQTALMSSKISVPAIELFNLMTGCSSHDNIGLKSLNSWS